MNEVRCVLGVDPGATGALAFYFAPAGRVTVMDMPVADKQVNGTLIARKVELLLPDIAVIELVGAMPGQGVSSMFNFGKAVGAVIGAIQACEIPVHFVTPAKWKRHFGLTSDKDGCRRKALEMFPHTADDFARVKDHGRAEAALIAAWGARFLLSQSVTSPALASDAA